MVERCIPWLKGEVAALKEELAAAKDWAQTAESNWGLEIKKSEAAEAENKRLREERDSLARYRLSNNGKNLPIAECAATWKIAMAALAKREKCPECGHPEHPHDGCVGCDNPHCAYCEDTVPRTPAPKPATSGGTSTGPIVHPHLDAVNPEARKGAEETLAEHDAKCAFCQSTNPRPAPKPKRGKVPK